VNTGTNGRGPLRPPDRVHQGNEVLCNPPGRGLGPQPTADTGFTNVDMFAWTTNPGESGGPCRPGAPKTGVFWPAYALMLVRNANFNSR
jgi:endoglucanase